VNVKTMRGRDGKVYPVTRDRAELARIIGLEHALACREGLSRPMTQRRLLMRYGIRRSIGAISQDLRKFECPQCSAEPEPASPPARPEVFAWR
jgi:hypothetical protein